MKRIEKVANQTNGRSRKCAKCPLNTRPKTRCTEEIWGVCRSAFVSGFVKGATWQKTNKK